MKVPKEINKLLSNKYVLYVVAFLSLTNVIAYLVAQDYNSLLFFAIIGYLVSYFSKNMTIILLCALIITNLLMTAKSIQNQSGMHMRQEGMDNMDNKDKEDHKDKDFKINQLHGIGDNKKKDEKDKKEKSQFGPDGGEEVQPREEQGTETMKQRENLATSNGSKPTVKEDFDIAALAGGLGKTMENISPNQAKKMNQEAGALLESQKQLAENLKTMGPLLETAKGMMDTLSGSEGMLSKLGMIGGLM